MTKSIFKITQRIPEKVANLEEEKQCAIKLKAKAERRKIFWMNTTATATAGAAIVATITLGVVFPPGLLILPIILPIVGLMGVMGGNNELQKAACGYLIPEIYCSNPNSSKSRSS